MNPAAPGAGAEAGELEHPPTPDYEIGVGKGVVPGGRRHRSIFGFGSYKESVPAFLPSNLADRRSPIVCPQIRPPRQSTLARPADDRYPARGSNLGTHRFLGESLRKANRPVPPGSAGRLFPPEESDPGILGAKERSSSRESWAAGGLSSLGPRGKESSASIYFWSSAPVFSNQACNTTRTKSSASGSDMGLAFGCRGEVRAWRVSEPPYAGLFADSLKL